MANPDLLIKQIATAFEDVPYPGDENLTSSTYGPEPAALIVEFKGKTTWQSLDTAFLDQAPDGWSSAISFFSAEALHFYLPAYLIADIEGKLLHTDPSSRLCYAVTPMVEDKKIAKFWGGGTIGDHARNTFSRFNKEQVSAIVAYLWWKLEINGNQDLLIEQALENYWLEREQSL